MTTPTYTLTTGDCLTHLRTLPDNSVHAIVTDPPYGLNFMGKKWDYDVPQVEIWQECLRVLKPGGYLLAFAGTRTQHRMAVTIEDAGFEIRDMIAWVYGQGFPKSMDVSKALDKAAGAEREVTGQRDVGPAMGSSNYGRGDGTRAMADVTAPATTEAQQWAGWGTALKPALEPITVARKPPERTVAYNIIKHGTGALNIDGCRVGSELITTKGFRADTGQTWGAQGMLAANVARDPTTHEGRWPANLIHDGSPEVIDLFPSEAGASAPVKGSEDSAPAKHAFGKYGRVPGAFHGDSGSAARFFYCAKASPKDRHAGLENPGPQFQHGTILRKVENAEKAGNTHPTVKPTDLMRYLVRLVTPPGGTVLDPFMGSGSTGRACMLEGFDFLGMDLSAEYVAIAEARIQDAQRTYLRTQPVLLAGD